MNGIGIGTGTSTTTNWFLIAAVVFFIFFIILLVIWMFLSSGTASTIVIILAILFLFIAVGLFIYFWFFLQNNTNNNNNNNNNNNTPSGSTGTNGVKFGDIIQLRSNVYNQYISPCGTTLGNCGLTVSLRSDESFSQNNGEAVGLRKWKIAGGTMGTQVTYQSQISLLSVINSGNIPMAVCNVSENVEVTNNGASGTDQWIIFNFGTSTGNVNYGDLINLQNTTWIIDPNIKTYLGVCPAAQCGNDKSGTGCGLLVVPTQSQDPWIIVQAI
jgi:hypothetical protein